MNNSFQHKLINYMKDHHISQSTMRKALGISKPTLYFWLEGQREPHKAMQTLVFNIHKNTNNINDL